VAEQFTHFGTVQVDGQRVANPAGQYLDSSISQVFAGYNLSDRFGIQINLPLIHRTFRRPVGFAIDEARDAGLGDVSVLGNLRLISREKKDFTLNWSVIGGVKFPTGRTTRLTEEFNEVEVPGAPESGIHGHDLTLGSGSYDGLMGSSIFARRGRFFATANVQYTIRSTGDFEYHFANDLTWGVGPGYYLLLEDNYTLALQLAVSGERKGLDTFAGATAADTGVTALYLGPQATFSWSDKLSVQVGVDIPVVMDNTALQTVPDYRLRAALTWHF
jgi:hypothetical protein